MSTHKQNRVAKGVTSGGQYAHTAKTESDVSLAPQAHKVPDPGAAKATADAAQIAQWARNVAEHGYTYDVDGQYPDYAAAQLAPTVNRDVIIDEYFHPMTLAASRAHQHAERYPQAHAQFDELQARLAERLERENRWLNDPTFELPSGTHREEQVPGHPVVYIYNEGGKVNKGLHDATKISAELRKDFRDAQRAGYLPDDLDLRVTTSKYSGGQSIRISLSGWTDDRIYQPQQEGEYRRRYTPSMQEARERVQFLGDAYNSRESSWETDYSASTYYCLVDVVDEQHARWIAEEKALAKARREARAATRSAA